MTFITADRIKETTTVTGTGPITLLGAVSGYRSFASVMEMFGDTCPYAIVNANASQWEVGIATYTDVNTLTRTTIHASTADPNTEPVDFAAGVKDVFLAPTARTVLSDLTSDDGTVILGKVGSIINLSIPTVSTSNGGTGLTSIGSPNQALAVNSAGTELEYHNVVGSVTSADGSVAVTQTGSAVDLSVSVAAAATNVVVQVRNNTGATLTKGTVVYINDAIGQIPTVAKALATSDNTSAQTLGLMSADLANNSNGFVTIIGLITGINTQAYNDGDQLYLSDSVAGTFTNVKPLSPSHLVYVGVVEYKNPSNGKIFVKVQNGYELDELHNVSAQNPSDGQTIVYNSTNQLWEKNYVSKTNSLSAVPVVSGAGNNLTLAAGSGVGTGAGGSLVLQAGIQATSGGDGKVVVKQVTGQTSNLQEWQLSNNTVIGALDANGNITTKLGTLLDGCIFVYSGSATSGDVIFGTRLGSGLAKFLCGYVGVTIKNDAYYRWSSGNDAVSSPDLYLYRDDAGTLAQRNGTNAQAFRLYNTYTDASNYERLGITWATNICTIGLAQAGTGSTRNLVVAGANATTGAGGNVTITAGNGSGVGAGGNVILQPGAQGTSGGNGKIRINDTAGVDTGFNFTRGYAGYPTLDQSRLYLRAANDNNQVIEFRTDTGAPNISMGLTGAAFTLGGNNTNYVGIKERSNSGTLAVISSSGSVGGSLSFVSSTTAIATNTNNLALPASAFQRLNCTGVSSLTGIAPVTGTGSVHVDGRMIRIYNVGAYNLTLAHNSASSTTGNKFFNATGADIILAPNDYAELIYDSTNNGSGNAGWRVA